MAKYNESVRDIFGLGRVAGEIGLELEMEGRGFIPGAVPPYWVFHRDGSLRGEESAEYVLGGPISRKDIPIALEGLFLALKKNGCRIRKDSPNTSVHVHLNMQEWSMKKVYNLISLWYIFEKTLVDWCGEERAGNLFCLRGGDAEIALQRLASAVRYNRYNTIADQEGLRYSALNYTALAKFGSLEFRSLAGVYDEDVINTWVRILLALKDYAEKFVCPSDIIVEMSRLGHDAFFRAVFGELARKVTNPDITAQMQQGMRLIQGVSYCVNWDRDTEVKKKEVDEPLGEEVAGTWWLGNFVPADTHFPAWDNRVDVDEYVQIRDRHNLIRRDRQDRRVREDAQRVEPANQPPDRPIARGNLWFVNNVGEFSEVHPDNFARMRERGYHPWVDRVRPVEPANVVANPFLEGRTFRDRRGDVVTVMPGMIVTMYDEDDDNHPVTRGNIERRIAQGWTFNE